MKDKWKLILVSITFVMLTTPIIVQADINEKTKPSSKGDFGDNSLGTLEIIHLPLYQGWFKNHGIGPASTYYPPENNPTYDYYFCEVDGIVMMNFSLTVRHRLNPVSPFFASRYTWINKLWIYEGSTDIFAFSHKEKCTEEGFVTYYVNVTEEDQIAELETNGEMKIIKLWINVMPAVTENPSIHTLMELLPSLPLDDIAPNPIDINIHPVQC